MEFNTVTEDDLLVGTSSDDSSESSNILDSLKKELKRAVRNAPITLSIPGRPGMSITFDSNIEARTLQMWRKACNDKKLPDNFDGLKFSSIIIANQATEIHYNGELVVDKDGDILNFKNQKFLEMLDAARAVEGVGKLYGVDGHIFIAADEILRAAGYDSEDQEQQSDPTLIS